MIPPRWTPSIPKNNGTPIIDRKTIDFDFHGNEESGDGKVARGILEMGKFQGRVTPELPQIIQLLPKTW